MHWEQGCVLAGSRLPWSPLTCWVTTVCCCCQLVLQLLQQQAADRHCWQPNNNTHQQIVCGAYSILTHGVGLRQRIAYLGYIVYAHITFGGRLRQRLHTLGILNTEG